MSPTFILEHADDGIAPNIVVTVSGGCSLSFLSQHTDTTLMSLMTTMVADLSPTVAPADTAPVAAHNGATCVQPIRLPNLRASLALFICAFVFIFKVLKKLMDD
jgi:hypothetical protein